MNTTSNRKNVRSTAVLLLLILCAAGSIAAELTPNEASTMQAKVVIKNTITFVPTGPEYRITHASGAVHWYPRDTWLEDVNSMQVTPKAVRQDESMHFVWMNPASQEQIIIDSTITTKGVIVPIHKKIAFPFKDVPSPFQPYLTSTKIIEITPEIRKLSQELAAGKEDANQVVFSFAEWTNKNINYSLSSLGQPASKTSSQVLLTKEGKCDELTALFIALNRAAGIPARFVGGYAYTNDPQFEESWGGHGWAEVWFPDQGWIPYDVTYGEYGYLDAGHIPMMYSADASTNSVEYQAKGNDFELQTSPLDISISNVQLSGEKPELVLVELDAPKKQIGFGSTVMLIATIKNLQKYYVPARVSAARVIGTTPIGESQKTVLLGPGETKKVYFLATIEKNLAPGYKYTYPFAVKSSFGNEATTDVVAQSHFAKYDLSSYAELIDQLTPKQQSGSVQILCDEISPVYLGNISEQTCTIIGAKNIPSTTSACAETCQTVQVQKNTFQIKTKSEQAGISTKRYQSKIGEERINYFVTTHGVVTPKINVSITNPESAVPDDVIYADAQLLPQNSFPKNLKANLRVRNSETTESLDLLERPEKLSFAIPGRALRPGDNEIELIITYEDELGMAYESRFTSKIQLTDVGIVDRILFGIEDAGVAILQLFKDTFS